MRKAIAFAIAFVLTSTLALAQEPIPQPTGPVLFCGTQAAPEASSYVLIFDDGTREPVTMAGVHETCPDDPTLTHSFLVDASRFTPGDHTVKVVAVNAFGETIGAAYLVSVGVKPGEFTVKHVIVLPAGE